MRINLVTPFAEKDEAKALGARWDSAKKCWYIVDVADLTPFLRWIPDIVSLSALGDLEQQLTTASEVLNHRRESQQYNSISYGNTNEQVRRQPMVIGGRQVEHARARIRSIHDALKRIADALDEQWGLPPSDSSADGDHKFHVEGTPIWSLGTVILQIEARPILRGNIEFRETLQIAPALTDRMVAFLMKVPGTRDQIIREIHGHWGYHYHYLDETNRRSDTLLTFDQNSSSQANPTLSWERHADGDKFKARAQKWCDDKRESVYGVCFPDTKRWALSVFKRPASNAEPVWPL
jgi:hypothetical protein